MFFFLSSVLLLLFAVSLCPPPFLQLSTDASLPALLPVPSSTLAEYSCRSFSPAALPSRCIRIRAAAASLDPSSLIPPFYLLPHGFPPVSPLLIYPSLRLYSLLLLFPSSGGFDVSVVAPLCAAYNLDFTHKGIFKTQTNANASVSFLLILSLSGCERL